MPTWNYSTVHLHSNLVIYEDQVWLGNHIRTLTAVNEAESERPWNVEDAPKKFIAAQLRAIVGIELSITRIDAKKKLSQNRAKADIPGVIAGLKGCGHAHMATQIGQSRARIPK